MKPIYEEIPVSDTSSFRIKRDILPHIMIPLHFHPYFELVYFVKGEGRRFVGDCIENFSNGDLVLLGSNLPHVWINNKEYYQGRSDTYVDVVVIHFREDAFGNGFFNLPEMRFAQNLFDKSTRGIAIKGRTNMVVATKMLEMLEQDELYRFINLIEILDAIDKNEQDQEILSVGNYSNIGLERHSERLNNVFNFVSENYERSISLEDISSVANMSKAAFCRYFKQVIGKNFSEYLNEIRINYAKKILLSKHLTVSEVGYMVGYSTPSYFNKQFKKLEGKTPLEFLKDHAEV